MTGADFRTGIDAAVGLFLGRPGALGRFDVSLEGFWRSFAAILLVLPSFAVTLVAEWRMQLAQLPADVDPSWLGFAAERTVALGLDFVALPIVLALLARRLGVTGRYVPFVVARNWAAPLIAALYAVPALLFALGIVRGDIAVVVSLVLLVVILHFLYRVARQALGVPVGMAIAVVVLDLLLGLLISETLGRLWPA